MNKKKLLLLFIAFFVFASLFGCSNKAADDAVLEKINTEKTSLTTVSGNLEVHYIDVGQGDSILIKVPDGNTLLIDAGSNSAAERVTGYLENLGIKRVDYAIGTHPHEDHIGGMDVVIKSFDIGEVYLPKVGHTSKTYEDLLLAIKDKGLKVTEAKGGVQLDLGEKVSGVFVAPNSTNYESMNNYSAVLKITYGETKFIFTGDAELKSEEEMLLQSRTPLNADVLKVGHHGSVTSTGQQFLDAVSPKIAVISVGENNDYGHPHQEIIERLEKNNVQVFRTDMQGTIIAVSNGKEINLNKGQLNSKVETEEPIKDVKILSIDLRQELVVIQNTGHTPVNLSGWKLISIKGNDEFVFPENFILKCGDIIKIVSGPEAVEGADTLLWTTKNVWNNSGDPGVLFDAKGQEISRLE